MSRTKHARRPNKVYTHKLTTQERDDLALAVSHAEFQDDPTEKPVVGHLISTIDTWTLEVSWNKHGTPTCNLVDEHGVVTIEDTMLQRAGILIPEAPIKVRERRAS